jgi:hypothetical protein
VASKSCFNRTFSRQVIRIPLDAAGPRRIADILRPEGRPPLPVSNRVLQHLPTRTLNFERWKAEVRGLQVDSSVLLPANRKGIQVGDKPAGQRLLGKPGITSRAGSSHPSKDLSELASLEKWSESFCSPLVSTVAQTKAREKVQKEKKLTLIAVFPESVSKRHA